MAALLPQAASADLSRIILERLANVSPHVFPGVDGLTIEEALQSYAVLLLPDGLAERATSGSGLDWTGCEVIV